MSITQAKVQRDVFTISNTLVKSYVHSKKVGKYFLGPTLGKGSFATVKEGLHISTGEKVAIKILDKEQCNKDSYMIKHFRRESRLLGQLRHPGVIHLLEVMETKHTFYLVLELCPGNLLALVLKKSARLPETRARHYLHQLIVAVDYLHKAGVLHRDLKVENILLTEKDNIKLIDFGLSTMVKATEGTDGSVVTQLCKTQCGSPAYAAPEVLSRKPYGHKADIWSIGVNLFAMVSGGLPFSVEPYDIKMLCKKMLNREMNPISTGVSEDCIALIRRFLDPDPDKRINLQEAQRHPWFLGSAIIPVSSRPLPQPDVHLEVVRHIMERSDYGKVELIRLIRTNTPSPGNAAYHLLYTKLRNYCRANKIAIEGVKSVPQKEAKKLKVALKPEAAEEDSWIDMTKSSRKGEAKTASADKMLTGDNQELELQNRTTRWTYSRYRTSLSPRLSSRKMSPRRTATFVGSTAVVLDDSKETTPGTKLGVRFSDFPTKLGNDHMVTTTKLPQLERSISLHSVAENSSLQPNVLSYVGLPNPNRKVSTGRPAYFSQPQPIRDAGILTDSHQSTTSSNQQSLLRSSTSLRRSKTFVPVSEVVHYSLDLRTGRKRMISSDITAYMQDGVLVREKRNATMVF